MVDQAATRATYYRKVVEDVHDMHGYLVKVSTNLPPFFVGTGGGGPPIQETTTIEDDPSDESSSFALALVHDLTSISSTSVRVVFKREPL